MPLLEPRWSHPGFSYLTGSDHSRNCHKIRNYTSLGFGAQNGRNCLKSRGGDDIL